MTATERIKAKLEKRQADIKELKERLKAEEVAERKAKENAAKLEAICPDIAKAIQDILAKAEVTLPEGQQLLTAPGEEDGLITTVVEHKVTRTGSIRGAPVRVDGIEYPSGADACRKLNIDYGAGSAVMALERAQRKGAIKNFEKVAR